MCTTKYFVPSHEKPQPVIFTTGSNAFGVLAEKSAKVFVQHCLSAVWGEQLALREGVRGVGGRFYVFSLTQATISPGGKATWDKYKIIAEIYFRIPCLWLQKWSFYLRFSYLRGV